MEHMQTDVVPGSGGYCGKTFVTTCNHGNIHLDTILKLEQVQFC